MARFTLQAFTNATRGSRFFAFNNGDTFRYAGRVTVEAPSISAACEVAWAVGNRQEPDADGIRWPFFIRSLSVGDLLVEVASDTLTAHAVAPAGFSDPVVVSLEPTEDGVRFWTREADPYPGAPRCRECGAPQTYHDGLCAECIEGSGSDLPGGTSCWSGGVPL